MLLNFEFQFRIDFCCYLPTSESVGPENVFVNLFFKSCSRFFAIYLFMYLFILGFGLLAKVNMLHE